MCEPGFPIKDVGNDMVGVGEVVHFFESVLHRPSHGTQKKRNAGLKALHAVIPDIRYRGSRLQSLALE